MSKPKHGHRSRSSKRDTTKKVPTLRIAVLVSGSGTTLQNLIDRIADGRMPGVEIAIVISSRANAAGVARAENAGLPVEIIYPKDQPDVERFSDQLALTLDVYAVNLVVQAGWLCYWKLPKRWLNKTINIHPSLLPKFGGKGFYGHHVHEAVLAASEPESGATVHWVDNEYDHGRIIAQQTCPVEDTDTPDTLAARVQAIERELLPATILSLKGK